jgi:hypothetical protein
LLCFPQTLITFQVGKYFLLRITIPVVSSTSEG